MKYKGITIHKTKNCKTWYTRFRKNGKQYYISAKTQKECYNKLKLAYANIDYVKPEEPKQITYTLKQWYEEWLKLYKIGKVKDSTLREYKTMLKYIKDEIQNSDIQSITLSQILSNLNECKSDRQRQKLYDFYKMLYQKAYDNDLVNKNIVERIDKPKHDKKHGKALTNEEQKQLIKICQTIKNADFMLIAMYQGLRRGEVLGLTINNIDFENNTLTIEKSYNQQNKFDTTKNKQSMRTMPLFEESKQILLKYKNKPKDSRIFELTTKQHELITKEIKEKTMIKDLKTKDMRTTFITRCTELKIPEQIIQSWVGHKLGSIVTKQNYIKHNLDNDNKYIDILNNSKFYSNSTQQK